MLLSGLRSAGFKQCDEHDRQREWATSVAALERGEPMLDGSPLGAV
jgi:hypothetical protein